ncbi:hypothetical protein MMC25_004857 [Agyrium rufum]|nr:hypothetical protein [Agyrium rufum]
MDPVSIIVGIIALIGATASVIKSAEKLRTMFHANDEICALINELMDLKCVLTTADLNQGQPSSELASHLQNIIQRTNDKLSELELIINSRLLKPKIGVQTPVVDRRAWLRDKSRIESIQKYLRYLTSAFSLVLVTSTSSGVTRVELAVTALATTITQTSGSTETRLGQLHQAMEALHLPTADLLVSIRKKGMCRFGRGESPMGVLVPDPVPVHVMRNEEYDHLYHSMASWEYSSLAAPGCPSWFVKRAFVTSFRLTSLSGPEVTLKVARIVPDTSPVFQLARASNIQGMKYLFENSLTSPYDIGGGLGSTPLHYAVDRPGNFEVVRFLISAGPLQIEFGIEFFGKGLDDENQYIELLGDLSRTEQLERRVFAHLHNIVLDQVPGNLDLELRTSYGITHIDDVDADGISPLIWAARRGDYAAVETLLSHGANVSIASHTGATALYYAGASPSPDAPAVIRALLKASAPVNDYTFRIEFPLHIGVIYHDDPKNFILPLVNYGADINARDCRGISVLDLAIQSDHVNSVAFLLDQGVLLDRLGGDNITGLSVTIIYNSWNVLKLLMDRSADSSVVSKEQKTLLHLAAAYADSRTLDRLITYGLDVDREAKDSAGLTAEDIFARRSDKDGALIISFEGLLESLGSGSIVFGALDPKGLTIITDIFQPTPNDSPTSEGYFDAKEGLPDWSRMLQER